MNSAHHSLIHIAMMGRISAIIIYKALLCFAIIHSMLYNYNYRLLLCLTHTCLLLFLTCCVSGTTEYYVRPTHADDNISCPVEYCPTLSDISDFIELNNTIFTLLPGNHTLKRPLQIGNVNNFVIKGLLESDSVIIQPEAPPDFVSTHFIHIKNAVSIKIANITMKFTKRDGEILWLETCTNVKINLIKISGVPSGGTGLWVTNSNNIAASNLVISNMIFGIYCEQTTEFSLKNSKISLCHEYGAHMYYGKSALIANSTFTGNMRGAIDIYSYSNFMIHSVISSQSEIGLRVSLSFFTQVKNVSFYHMYAAISIQQCDNTTLMAITAASNMVNIYARDSHSFAISNFVSVNTNGLSFKNIKELSIEGFYAENNIHMGLFDNTKYFEIRLSLHEKGMYFDNCRKVKIVNMKIKNTSHEDVIFIFFCFEIQMMNVTVKMGKYGIFTLLSGNIIMNNISLYSISFRGLHFTMCTNVYLNHVSIIGYSVQGIQIIDCYEVYILNAILGQNSISVTNTSDMFLFNISIVSIDKHALALTNSHNISIEASSFSDIDALVSQLSEPFVVDNRAIIYSYNSILTVINCTFSNNEVSSITASNSTVKLEGYIVFQNISTETGAALTLSGKSVIIVSKHCHALFKTNHATRYGAAFHITLEQMYDTGMLISEVFSEYPSQFDASQTNCFLKVEGFRGQTPRLTFINNTAEKGGDVLYGGLVASGYDGDWNCLLSFKNVSDMSEQSSQQPFKRITSEPSRVCLCHHEVPDCLIVVDPTVHSLYPGEIFTLHLVVVGQDFGTVSGFVHAQFMDNKFVFISQTQSWVPFKNGACQNLNYTMFSSCIGCEAVLVLTPDQSKVPQSPDPSFNEKLKNTMSKLSSDGSYHTLANNFIDEFGKTENAFGSIRYIFYTDKYERAANETIKDFYTVTTEPHKLHFPIEIYRYPLYIHIVFKPCPLGFDLLESQCSCNSLLQQIPTVECDIQTQSISRHGFVWVGLYNINSSIIAASQYCPLKYCKEEPVQLNFDSNENVSQCNFRRSGVLCGGCQIELSLALGSDQCLPCSNMYLLLILPFALAGLLLVFLIKSLDLTVCHGAINGMIFFVNIINANKSFLFNHTTNNPILMFIAWFNLDLGIETCFYDGLTAYARTWLQFLFPFYMWSIAGGIIILARYSQRIAKLSGNTGVPVLSTLFLLSYAKLFNTIISVVSYTTLYTTDGPKHVWSSDGNLQYLGLKHSFLFVMAISVLLFLWLPYTVILLFGRQLHKIKFHLLNRYLLKLKPFLDANYAPLNSHHEYWFGVTLIVKATVLLASATVPANSTHILIFSVAVACTMLLFWGHKVYQNSSNVLIHKFFLINLTLLNTSKLFNINNMTRTSISSNTLTAIFLLVCVVMLCTKICRVVLSYLKRSKNEGHQGFTFEFLERDEDEDSESSEESEVSYDSSTY